MKKFILLTLSLFFSSGISVAQKSLFPSLGESRSGTSGFQFLKINVDARSSGMGFSNVADATDASSLFLNPALSAQSGTSQFYIGHTAYIADISLNTLSYIHKLENITLGTFLLYLDSGEMQETDEFAPLGTGRTFRTTHISAGVSVAQELSELFSYGITAKYAQEKIEEINVSSVLFDLGFFYKVGTTGLRFAVGLNNFGADASPTGTTERRTIEGIITESEFEDVSPPAIFQIGAAFDAYETETLKLLITGQLINPSDNAERYTLGSELIFMDQFYLRTGYQFGLDEYLLPSGGVGVKVPFKDEITANVDYGFSDRERLGLIHRISIKFNF